MPKSIASDTSNTLIDTLQGPFFPPGDHLTCGLHHGESSFDYSPNNCTGDAHHSATERLVLLMQELKYADTGAFWGSFMEGLTSICSAQYCFVAQWLPQSDQKSSSRLLALAFYYNDGHQLVGIEHNRYFAGGNPDSHMDHERPCLITKDLASFISPDLDKLPFAAEAYLSIPLFSDHKCVAYLGLMWSDKGLQKRVLPWPDLERILGSLEDFLIPHVLNSLKSAAENDQNGDMDNTTEPRRVTEGSQGLHDFSTHTLKMYARSLSHELRTPMQGVVGMLDVMHATVCDAIENKNAIERDQVFQSLKESIEMIQDSARRAVEAADNVVHAYELNMQVPKTPQIELEHEILGTSGPSSLTVPENRPDFLIEGSNIRVNSHKRRRSNAAELSAGPAMKQRVLERLSEKNLSRRGEEVKSAVHESKKIVHSAPAQEFDAVMAKMTDARPSLAVRRSAPHLVLEGIDLVNPSLRFTNLRDLLRLVINESLHVGGRPDFAASETTDLGEKIEVRSRSFNGETSSKIIIWSVDPALPETLLVDDRDFAKLVSCVFLNAIKFTNSGSITVYATTGSRLNEVLITVQDTGPGIPEAFLPNLFKPFAREDTSTTRSKEGLGLGLLVAKGLARKMGGDLICRRSSTSGPERGSEFEIRVPVSQPEGSYKPVAPTDRILSPSHLKNSFNSKGSPGSVCYPPTPFQPASSSQPQEHLARPPSPYITSQNPSQNSMKLQSASKGKNGRTPINGYEYDRRLGEKYPLTFLIAEDNRINRRVLVQMLRKLGYRDVYEACDGKEAVRIMQNILKSHDPGFTEPQDHSADTLSAPPALTQRMKPIDVVLMDLWMPEMDGYQAAARIFEMLSERQISDDFSFKKSGTIHDTTSRPVSPPQSPTILAVSADVSDEALERASKVGIKGYMTKPYKLSDLERLIVEFCGQVTDSCETQ
ncbi:hypothetical protein ASPZODRAFT_134784 [Penicilliopsis zonata CBS 506.65]|uniref:histidine kinase n=1 Tax=Penicilliopsis zonata CBS 506.65 TaxID=1073090 RepID=A0A1L9SC25_9EURO|nr:hypothetical protein ASPZODRAFT_134784 [Penicilliopsis zonata CBS 506.65]OJJ44692.1 hypothetical protein ASPZODRAFT_134784 [Penicilliopsis zonata CBS 506.65]